MLLSSSCLFRLQFFFKCRKGHRLVGFQLHIAVLVHDDKELLIPTRLSRAFGLFRGRATNDLIDEPCLAGGIHDLDELPVRGTLVVLDVNHRVIVQQLPLRLQFFFKRRKGHWFVVQLHVAVLIHDQKETLILTRLSRAFGHFRGIAIRGQRHGG